MINMAKKNDGNIGILDSGIGGISILRKLEERLPLENYIYLADRKNFAYGEKSKEEIIKILENNTDWFLKKRVKIIVIACNTATVNGIYYLRNKYSQIKWVGLEPAVKPAAAISNKGIMVLSSELTAKSKQLDKLSKNYGRGKVKYNIGSQELVKAVEDNWSERDLKIVLDKIFTADRISKIDSLVLGCTHFALIKDKISKYLGNKIKVFDSGEAVARQVEMVLDNNQLINDSGIKKETEFYSTKGRGEFEGMKFKTVTRI